MISTDRTARSLFLALTLIVASFVSATAYTHLGANDIDRLANGITLATSPSIRALSEVRMTVRQLELRLVRYLAAVADDRTAATADRQAVEGAREECAERILEYLQLPVMPAERDLWKDVTHELQDFDAVVARSLTLVDLGQLAAAQAAASGELAAHANSTSLAVSRAIDFNAREASELASSIRRTRSRMSKVAFTLDVVCAFLACAAGVLVWRASRRYTSLLEAQRMELARRNDELEQFAGRVAHDIVSPLSTAALALDFGEKRAESTGQHARLFASGKRSIMRVRRVVDGLLEFARAGARPAPDASALLSEVLDDVLAGYRAEATAAGIDLVCEAEDAAVTLRCSPGALTSVLSNLIGNGLKYMGESPVRRIIVRCRRFEQRARVEVHDTGPGLAPNLERDIFEPYVRGTGSTQPGIGLGLATVSRIVRSHGGSVGVRSTPGGGCSFWFDLPYATQPITPSMLPPSRPSVDAEDLLAAHAHPSDALRASPPVEHAASSGCTRLGAPAAVPLPVSREANAPGSTDPGRRAAHKP